MREDSCLRRLAKADLTSSVHPFPNFTRQSSLMDFYLRGFRAQILSQKLFKCLGMAMVPTGKKIDETRVALWIGMDARVTLREKQQNSHPGDAARRLNRKFLFEHSKHGRTCRFSCRLERLFQF